MGSGEPLINQPAVIQFPGYEAENETQHFPFRTFCTIVSMATILVVTKISKFCDKGSRKS